MDNTQSGEDDGSTYFSSQPEQAQAIQQGHCVYLKVLSPFNKKDFSMFSLRDIKPDDTSTLDELKEEVFMQCRENAQLPRTLEFKVGIFAAHRSFGLTIHTTFKMPGILFAGVRDLPCGHWELQRVAKSESKSLWTYQMRKWIHLTGRFFDSIGYSG